MNLSNACTAKIKTIRLKSKLFQELATYWQRILLFVQVYLIEEPLQFNQPIKKGAEPKVIPVSLTKFFKLLTLLRIILVQTCSFNKIQ